MFLFLISSVVETRDFQVQHQLLRSRSSAAARLFAAVISIVEEERIPDCLLNEADLCGTERLVT